MSFPHKVVYSKFSNFSSDSNGGVFYIAKNIEFCISTCMFSFCATTGSTSGGCIFFQSSKSFALSKCCANDCSAKDGPFTYISGATNAQSYINSTMTTCCKSSRYVCVISSSEFISEFYNSSHCYTSLYCNVQIYKNVFVCASYYHLYKNEQDILFGVNSNSDKLTFSHACLISNDKVKGAYGYIHANQHPNEIFTIDDIFAYDNKNILVNPNSGTIIVKSFVCDDFTYTGVGPISMTNVVTDKSFKMITKYKRILICENNKHKCTCKVIRHKSYSLILMLELIYYER